MAISRQCIITNYQPHITNTTPKHERELNPNYREQRLNDEASSSAHYATVATFK